MAAPSRGPISESKGGGYRGGPKRWTGGGPRPARHIPWPEIFKHHISVVEGHLKMLEMVKKHTVPETGNWRQICPMVDRSYEMLRMAKDATRSFVPRADQREQVPLGSSSASMYPGYSPADHEYGKAAEEYGLAVAAARKQGIDLNPTENGPEYKTAQARGLKRTTLAGMRAAKAGVEGGSGSDPGSDSDTQFVRDMSTGSVVNGQAAEVKSEDETAEGENTYFVIDTNPTPVNLPGLSHKPTKRATEDPSPPEPVEQKKSKKVKTKHDGELPGATLANNAEFEDISEEVDARLKEKEVKRRRKEEKKRKRLSEGPAGAVVDAASTEAVTEEPKKKKAKKVQGDAGEDGVVTKKRHGSDGEDAVSREGQKKKRKKSKKSEDI